MRLLLGEGAEEVIRRVCPHRNPTVAKCIHCDPKTAPCMASEDAYECVKGIICIDGGDPSDVHLCPYNALFWNEERGQISKCDLCANGWGYPLCYLDGSRRIKIVLDEEELDEIGRRVGWIVYGDAEFPLKFDPILPWEARLAEEAITLFEKTKGEFSVEEVVEDVSLERDVPAYTSKRLITILNLTLAPLGPLKLIEGKDVEEIAVVGLKRPVKVFLRGGGWLDTNLYIWTDEYFAQLVNRAAESLGRRITLREPRVNAVLSDGSRIHAAIPPLSNVHTLTVRRYSSSPLTPSHLLDSGMIDAEHLSLLWLAMEEEKNLLIAGNTGSGKTTLLNALFGFVSLRERIVSVEEVPEVRLPHLHFIRLIPWAGITMRDLIRDTLRMRPDRVIVGEIRKDEEAQAYMDTVLAGQGRGSYATIHGRSVGEVGSRLVSMGVRREDLESVDLVVVLRRRGRGGAVERKLVEVGAFSGESVYDILDVDEEEVRRRADVLKENPVYDLEAFARRYGGGG